MSAHKYAIGIDYGTLSARAVVVSVENGEQLASVIEPYPHGVLSDTLPDGTLLGKDYALAVPEDYSEVLEKIIKQAVLLSGINPEDVIGIGVDATTCTLIPTDENGHGIASREKNRGNPHAYIKLWKHHAALDQTKRLEEMARKENMKFLYRSGHHLSCEWAVPKIMEVREESPNLYEEIQYFVDLADWVNWILTGKLTRSTALAGIKSFWSFEDGYPEKSFWDKLYLGFGDELEQKLWGSADTMIGVGQRAGFLCKDMADKLGLPEGIAVGAGMADGHSCIPAIGMLKKGEASLIIGTSNVLAFIHDKMFEIDGICAVAYGAFLPGCYGYDTGQNCTGDMLNWFREYQIPTQYEKEAIERNIDIHTLLCEKAVANKPSHNTLTVLDWWNGNRSVLCDMNLTGGILGLTLQTKPEDIYCAMLQSIACGTKKIIERCQEYGIEFTSIIASGGIPLKNQLLMQEYANILNLPVKVPLRKELPALGSAIFAVGASAYSTLEEAVEKMKVKDYITYEPQKEYLDEYKKIYLRYSRYYDLLGVAKDSE